MGDLDDYPDDEEDDTCQRCGGSGYFHDCGEDICFCEDSELDEDIVECPDCGGTGVQ